MADQTPKPVAPVEELEHALVEAIVVGGRWRVRFTEDTRHVTPYDGEGFGATIEEALRATIEEALRAAIGDAHANLVEPGRDPQSIFTECPATSAAGRARREGRRRLSQDPEYTRNASAMS